MFVPSLIYAHLEISMENLFLRHLLQGLATEMAASVLFSFIVVCMVVTPHAQRERGKVIGCGVHIYIYMFVDEKNI